MIVSEKGSSGSGVMVGLLSIMMTQCCIGQVRNGVREWGVVGCSCEVANTNCIL